MLCKLMYMLRDRSDAARQLFIVGLGDAQKRDAGLPQRVDARHDVAGRQRNMLDAGATVVIEVLLDLALPAPLGWLVDWELDPPGAVLHHLAHQRRVLSADILVVEVDEL